MKDNLYIAFLLVLVFGGVFILTTAMSDIWDYKSGLYVQGMQASKDIERWGE